MSQAHNGRVRSAVVAICAASFLCGGDVARAGSATTTLSVGLVVARACSMATNAGIVFVDRDNAPALASDALGSLSVSCVEGTRARISLSAGQHPGPDGSRRMRAGVDQFLAYELYADEARTEVWRAVADGGVRFVGRGGTQELPVYARIRPDQETAPGLYEDVVVVTISY